ncbi:uncharacterized protein LOC142295178 isoform X2 [Anomaloglossus baeobatrachus]|uniref:uncharacterized protein LOC142295178 isoform X2 n=1 Tax=Anomaloglossus baeobatrachus TaxID=238106 RepID=UPI003F4FDF9C
MYCITLPLSHRYGTEPWHEKAECTNITQNWCDLRNETSAPSEDYYGMVTINGQGCNTSRKTDRFKPLLESVLDPPKVNLFLTSTSLTINLTHVTGDLSNIYEAIIFYKINIIGLGTYISEEPYYKKDILELPTNICIAAKLSHPAKSNFSNYTCIKTKTDNTSEERIHIMLYILAASIVIFVVFGAGYSVHKYIYVGNLEQPQILNITSNNNNNVVFVDGYNNVTINVIKIETSKSNEKSSKMTDKEEETKVETDLYFKDDGYDTSHSLVTKDDDHGYVSLVVQAPVTKPAAPVSSYDMPHDLVPKTSLASTATLNKEDNLYGRVKCHSIQKKNKEETYQKANMSQQPFTYLPKNDQNLTKSDVLSNKLYEIEESAIGQAADNIDGTDATDFSDCDTLFVDWSPTSRQLYMPNFHSKAVDEVGPEECQEVKGLLAHLYKPMQVEENSEELTCLEQKWGLHVKMQD